MAAGSDQSFDPARNMLRSVLLSALLALTASSASAAPCVKIRNGADGYTCMKFSEAERKDAARLGLRLGSTYATVRAHLTRSGWRIDQAWLDDLEADAKRDLPVCGQGWDALCLLQVKQGSEVVELVFSGTNTGFPLVSARPVP